MMGSKSSIQSGNTGGCLKLFCYLVEQILSYIIDKLRCCIKIHETDRQYQNILSISSEDNGQVWPYKLFYNIHYKENYMRQPLREKNITITKSLDNRQTRLD